jgi:hypothetical protein
MLTLRAPPLCLDRLRSWLSPHRPHVVEEWPAATAAEWRASSARSWRRRCARSCRWRLRKPGGRHPSRRQCRPDAPHRRIADDESGGEILILASRHVVLHDHSDHLVRGPFAAIPRAMLGREDVADVFRRELLPGVKRDAERGRMGLEQNVGNGELVLEIRPLAKIQPRLDQMRRQINNPARNRL